MKSPQIHNYKEQIKDRNLQIRQGSTRSGHFGIIPKIAMSLLLVIVLLILLIFAWANFMRRPLKEGVTDLRYFEVRSGAGAMEIGTDLAKNDLIRSKWAFYLLARSDVMMLKAGHYKLSPAMRLDEILNKIKDGEVDAYSITIPEGYRSLQIAKLLGQVEKIDVLEFVEAASGKEGTLFPDTYLFPKGYEPSKIVHDMQANFEKRTKDLDVDEESLIIASIVEREALNDDERKKIAAVYSNRLRENMLMQADPTIRYSLDSKTFLDGKGVDFEFWQPITRADISSLVSEYNTYKQKGLPPAPICNPGLKSIEAAVNPEENFSDYYYFFHDESQAIHFSKTYNEHLQGIEKFGVSS